MATVSMTLAVDMTDLDLNRLYTYAWQWGLWDDQYLSVNGVTYEDLYVVDWVIGDQYYASLFGGYNMATDAESLITGGTATAYVETYWDGNSYIPYFAIEGASIPALEIWRAAQTASTADDDLLLATLLAGNDEIFGSTSSDTLIGYAGQDTFFASSGSDVIYGGSGLDIYSVIPESVDNISISAVSGGYLVSSTAFGSDLVYDVEFIELLDGTYSIDEIVSGPMSVNRASSGVTVTMTQSVNMADLNLNRLYANAWQWGLLDNADITFNGLLYEDLYVVDWVVDSSYFGSVFGGSNLSVDAEDLITAGSVSGYLETYWNGTGYVPYFAIEGASVNAVDIWNAALTSSNADDDALLKQILAGDDVLTGSSFEDNLVGFDGNDIFYASRGFDYIFGGVGADTYSALSESIDTISVSKIEGGYAVSSNSYSTDYLYDIEAIQLGSGTYNLSSFETDPEEPIYVLIVDNFGYQSAIKDNVVFLDYDFTFVAGMEDYFLDSLAPDEIDQLPYFPGFGMERVADENGSAYFSHYITHAGTEEYNQDYLAGDFTDNDSEWDYFVHWWDQELGVDQYYFVNDLDGIDTVDWVPSGLELGWYIRPYERFDDLDGTVDFYDEDDSDAYDKLDQDALYDYVFLNWEDSVEPDRSTDNLVFLSKTEIESLHSQGAAEFSDDRFHGDIVLDNFYSELEPNLHDNVVIIALDGADDYADQDSVWITDLLASGELDLDNLLNQTLGISISDISVINLSFTTTAPSAAYLESIADLGPTIVKTLPNNDKSGNRFWDAYYSQDVANFDQTLLAAGLNTGVALPEGYAYADIFFDVFDSEETGARGTSFAAPKAAAELTNLESDLREQGLSLDLLSQDELANYLNGVAVQDLFDFALTGSFVSGTGVDDSLAGGSLNDFIAGFEGDDVLSGGSGNDFLFPSLGNDQIDGGNGWDIIKYDANSTLFTLAQTTYGYELTHIDTGLKDTIQNVELISFSDRLLSLLLPEETLIRSVSMPDLSSIADGFDITLETDDPIKLAFTNSEVALPIDYISDATFSLTLNASTNEAVNISDVIQQLRHIVGLDSLSGVAKAAGDNDGNGTIDISDVINSLRMIVGLEETTGARLVDGSGNHEFIMDALPEELYALAPGDVDLSWAPSDLV